MVRLKHLIIKTSIRNRKMKPTKIVILSFLMVIFVGTLLLGLPISTRDTGAPGLLTALFTATSATCVTGLTLVDTSEYWSMFGQAVILILMQIGGLGFMSIISIFYFMLNKRVGLKDRLLIMQSLNLTEIEGAVYLLKNVLIGTFCAELIGAVILSGCFIPEYGWTGGIWQGVFHSVSAFCNAGFSILGNRDIFSNMTTYADNPAVMLTMACLILIGSTGFFVWRDIFRKKSFRRLYVHSKLVLIITALLVVLGMFMYLGLEWNNTSSIGDLSVGEKLLVSFFQSVSTRTAGFDAIGQTTLTDSTKGLSIILMFIGGSSGSTAGGIKTVTIGILILSAVSVLRGKRDLPIFEKKITQTQVINACSLVTIGVILIVAGSVVISAFNNVHLFDALFETVSCYGTSGLSLGLVGSISAFSHVLMIVYMFFGKVGILSLSIAYMLKENNQANYTYPVERVIVG